MKSKELKKKLAQLGEDAAYTGAQFHFLPDGEGKVTVVKEHVVTLFTFKLKDLEDE